MAWVVPRQPILTIGLIAASPRTLFLEKWAGGFGATEVMP
jgi:hypothetical protein